MPTDVHQHLWSEPLVRALAARLAEPRAVRHAGGWELRLPGEPPSPLTFDDPDGRAALARADGVDRVLIAPSSPVGAEWLEPDEAAPLVEAYAEGVRELPAIFGAWRTVGLRSPDPGAVDRLLDEGFVGLCLPAGAVATPAALDQTGPLLERLERRSAPLLVHPGPAAAPAGAPDWWPALTDYVSQMHAAWHAWALGGRARHPRLRIVFAMLAGLAPLHAERLVARGGPVPVADPDAFLDVSSYGPRAIGAVAAVLGWERLVHGSDRPVVEPPACRDERLTVENPRRLLG